jgi:uncharacterized membrane protein
MFKNQPKIDVKPSSRDRKLMFLGWLLVATNGILVVAFYFDLPETIATHFNLKGEADGFGSKETIWLLPILNMVLYYGKTLLTTKVKPWHYNYPTKVTKQNAPKLYAGAINMMVWVNVSIAVLFLLITVHTILISKNVTAISLGWLILPMVVILTVAPLLTVIKMFKTPTS